MKYVITGSSGFIGKYLVDRFPSQNVVTIPHIDLYDQGKLKQLIPEDTTHIYHLAGFGNMAYQKEADLIVKANILGLHNLLMVTKDIKYKAFIYFSSSSVYGVKNHPMHETNSWEATDYYGLTKAAGELIMKAFVNLYDKPVIAVRPFSVYGPGEADFRLIPTIIQCIKHSKPIQLAPGMHDWIYIDDFLEGVMVAQHYINDLKGKAVNIGTGQQYDNFDILKYLCMFSRRNINRLPVTYIENLRSFNSWVADNSLLRSLGWVQTYSLSEGLKKCWRYYK